MTLLMSAVFAFIIALAAHAQDQPELPGQQPINPNAYGKPNVGGNPFTFNTMNPPYGQGVLGVNPYSLREPGLPPLAESPLKSFEQTGAYAEHSCHRRRTQARWEAPTDGMPIAIPWIA
jgi:hypothetical protein